MVALSTAESDYVALSPPECCYSRRLLSDLGACPKERTILKEDNQGAIAISKNPVSHARTKHIDIKFHFIHEAVKEKIISLTYCPIEKMTADLLTKPLTRMRFNSLRKAMGMFEKHQE